MVIQSEINRFEEIMGEIKDLAEEALKLVPSEDRSAAQSYWYAWITKCVDDRGCMVTMGDTLESMKDAMEEEIDHEDECTECGSGEMSPTGGWVHNNGCSRAADNEYKPYYQYRRMG